MITLILGFIGIALCLGGWAGTMGLFVGFVDQIDFLPAAIAVLVFGFVLISGFFFVLGAGVTIWVDNSFN